MMILFLVCDGDGKVFLICKDFNVHMFKSGVIYSFQTCEFMSYSIYYLKYKSFFFLDFILSFLVYV